MTTVMSILIIWAYAQNATEFYCLQCSQQKLDIKTIAYNMLHVLYSVCYLYSESWKVILQNVVNCVKWQDSNPQDVCLHPASRGCLLAPSQPWLQSQAITALCC